jgi:hypothetical protein
MVNRQFRFVVAILVVLSAFSGPAAASNDPVVPKERGIYLAQEDGTLKPLMQARVAEIKPAGRLKAMVSYGLTGMKMKNVIAGVRAEQRASDQPVFYISGFEPAELLIYKFEVKGKQREFVTTSVSAFGSIKAPEGAIEFKAEKVEGGYKLTLPAGLKAGEYVISYSPVAMPMASSIVYDYGVDAAVTTSR